MSGEFVYNIAGVERKFLSTTYALDQSLKDLEIEDVAGLTTLFKFNTIIRTVRTFMFHSAVYACIKDKKAVDFEPMDIYAWIDETGGTKGDFYRGFTEYLIESLGFNQTQDEQEEPEDDTKKK